MFYLLTCLRFVDESIKSIQGVLENNKEINLTAPEIQKEVQEAKRLRCAMIEAMRSDSNPDNPNFNSNRIHGERKYKFDDDGNIIEPHLVKEEDGEGEEMEVEQSIKRFPIKQLADDDDDDFQELEADEENNDKNQQKIDKNNEQKPERKPEQKQDQQQKQKKFAFPKSSSSSKDASSSKTKKSATSKSSAAGGVGKLLVTPSSGTKVKSRKQLKLNFATQSSQLEDFTVID